MGRMILSVVAGFATWSAVWLICNLLVSTAIPDAFGEDDLSPSPGVLVLLLGVAIVCSLVGGFVTARLSRAKPVRNAVLLGVLLLAVGIFEEAQLWDAMPAWYHLIFLASLLPGAYVGARLRPKPGAAA